MPRRNPLPRICLGVLLLAGSLLQLHGAVQPPVVLNNSIRDVKPWQQAGTPDPRHPFITRQLKAAESDAVMEFSLALKMRNFDEFQARVARGERISPQEIAVKYSPLQSDYQAADDWLTSQGFTITHRDPHRLGIFASGKVSHIQQKLQTSFARVAFEGKEYTSAIIAPSIPATLSPFLVGVNGLQPHIHPHRNAVLRPSSLTGTTEPYLPSQIAKAYQANGLYTSGVNGTNQSIAIVIDTFPLQSDLTNFWQTYGVSQSINNMHFIQVITGSLPAPEGEETLDTEWASSIAPSAQVRIYATATLDNGNLDQAYEAIFTDATTQPQLGLHQMSLSFGIGETYTTLAQVQTDAQYFAQLTAVGVTIFASSGDGASTPGNSSNPLDASGPLQAESPASDPNVTGVGGTSLTLDSNGNEATEVAWSQSGGGTSIYVTRPSWQTGTGVPGGTMRTVPDVSCSADPNQGAVVILNGSQVIFGGTSWSSPTWAGFCALMNQARTNAHLSSLGLLGPRIYPLNRTSNFRDITSGNNAIGGQSGGHYLTGTGYDEVTGLGSPLVQTLSQTLISSETPAQVQVASAVQSVVPGQNATLTVTALGSPISFQWQRMPIGTSTWGNLSDNGTYSGSLTATLTVQAATTAMSGDQFKCIVTYSSGPTTGPSITLIVDTPLTLATVAGTAGTSGFTNGTGTGATFAYPSGIAIDGSGNLYIADFNNNAIRKITPAGVVSNPFSNALVNQPNAVVADNAGNLYVANSGADTILKIVISSGTVTTFAGKAGVAGTTNATGTSARFNNPNGIAIDHNNTLYVADTGNNAIRVITTPGAVVSTLAGTVGSSGAGYLDAQGVSAKFNNPTNLGVDSFGNVYVADLNNDVIRKIIPNGTVTTIAGQPGIPGYLDGVGTNTLFNAPNGVSVDGANNLYITDALIPPIGSMAGGNSLLRRMTPAGVVSTIAGQPGMVGSTNGSPGKFYSDQFAAINGAGEVFLADTYNHLIRAGGYPPAVATQPAAQVVTVGQPATFIVSATGTGISNGSLFYQWLKNNVAISGATNATYTIPVTAASDTAAYSVVVTNTFGTATSNAVSLLIVNSQPVGQIVNAGQPVTFSISVTGTGGPFSYQWFKNGVAIGSATGATYTIPSTSTDDTGAYSVAVNDAFGIATTTPVSLTVTSVSTDTPTMPTWALMALTLLLFLVASPRLRKSVAAIPAHRRQ